MQVLPPKPIDDYTNAEQEFIDQRTRQLCVAWADRWVNYKSLPQYDSGSEMLVYFEYAKTMKWISADGTKLLTAGIHTASRFLKR